MTAFSARHITLIVGVLTAGLIAGGTVVRSRLLRETQNSTDPGATSDCVLVFADAVDGGLFLASTTGHQRRLTNPTAAAVDVSPAWSPDLDPATDEYQGRIAFLRRPHADCTEGDLCIVDPAGGEPEVVASLQWSRTPVPMDQNSGGFGESTLAWSPNGREIIFACRGCFWAVDRRTGEYRCLMQRECTLADPAVSAVRSQLVFHRDGDLATVDFDIDPGGLMKIRSETLSHLTHDGFEVMDEHPAWSPDGQFLAWRRSGEQLLVRNMANGVQYVVLDSGLHSELSWSSDGQQIAYCTHPFHPAVTSESSISRVFGWGDREQPQCIAAVVPTGTIPHMRQVDWKPDTE